MTLLVVVIHCHCELLVVWKYLTVLEIHLFAGDGAICIHNTQNTYILILHILHNQFTTYGHDNHCILRLFNGKYTKNNSARFTGKACLCDHLLVSHVKFSWLAIDEFIILSYFLNQFWSIKLKLLKRYKGFQKTETSIKYNDIYGTKRALVKQRRRLAVTPSLRNYLQTNRREKPFTSTIYMA